MVLHFRFAGIAMLGVLSLAACGGGGVNTTPVATVAVATPVPTAAPTAKATSTPTATPTTSATASPTPVPTPTVAGSTSAITFNPTVLSFEQDVTTCPNNNTPQTFMATESGFTGTFTAVASDTTLVTVTASAASLFTVTPSSNNKTSAQSVTITVSDGRGNTGAFPVNFNTFCLP